MWLEIREESKEVSLESCVDRDGEGGRPPKLWKRGNNSLVVVGTVSLVRGVARVGYGCWGADGRPCSSDITELVWLVGAGFKSTSRRNILLGSLVAVK